MLPSVTASGQCDLPGQEERPTRCDLPGGSRGQSERAVARNRNNLIPRTVNTRYHQPLLFTLASIKGARRETWESSGI